MPAPEPAAAPGPRRVAVLANPAAGRGHGPRLAGLLGRALRGDGHDVADLTAPTPALALRRCRQAVADGVDAVVAVGGDGLVHLAVRAVAGTPTALGVLAAGTGNDLARCLGLPTDDAGAGVAAVRAGLVAAPRRVDAALCRGSAGATWFAGVLAAGFDATVNRRANAMAWPRGRLRYRLAVARELPRLAPRRYVLHLDGVEQHTDAVLVAVANATSYGGGLRIAATAAMDDGRLDVVVVGPVSRAELVRVLPRLGRGGHLGHPQVRLHRAARVGVALAAGQAPQPAYADGEPVGALPLDCQVVPGALRVLTAAPAGTRTSPPGGERPDPGWPEPTDPVT